MQPPADTRVLLGLTAMLACRVSSDSSVPYNIDWYREGQAMPITNSQRVGVQADGTLELQAVRASDVGVYSCMVSSPSIECIDISSVLKKMFQFFVKMLMQCLSCYSGYITRWK